MEGPIIDSKIGGVIQNPSTGKDEFVDSNTWAREVRALYARSGPKKFEQFTQMEQDFLRYQETDVYKTYQEYAPETDMYGQLLEGEQSTTDYHNEMRGLYPELDAFEFLFGGRSTLKTGEALDIVVK